MANTTFKGPVRSEGGFQQVYKNPTTGAETVTATLGANTTVDTLTTNDDVRMTGGFVLMSNLPTADPTVAGQLWNNSGVLTVSAG